MIKVLLLIPTLDRSGAEKQFALLASRLPRDEFEVQAVALTRGGPYEALLHDAEIPLTVLGKRWRFDPAPLRKLKRLIEREQPDIVHAWLFAANATARLVAGRTPPPHVIISERCVDSWKSGWQLWLDRRQIGRTARLIGNSQSVVEFYRQLGYPAEKLARIPNGVEIPTPISPVEREKLITEFGIPPESRIVGYVGRLAAQKRVRDLIWGMQLLRQLTDRVHFVIVGDGPERNDLMRFAKNVDCEQFVHFAGHREDAARLAGLCDLLWLASDFEGMSNSIMEAMAAGVPVVASDIPANRELVVDGETGYLVKIGDSAGFAQFADRLLADPQKARQMGEAGRARMQKDFSIDRMVAAHAALYREVVGRAAATGSPLVSGGGN